jgi:O-methyltransferase involved in polyketide biosynthesis
MLGPMSAPNTSRISPTAHYTAQVWYRNGMSHQALTTSLGSSLHLALVPFNRTYRTLFGRPSLDEMLLARHRIIDHLLERAIVAGEVGQVVEIAAGLSPRGFRFARRHAADLVYVEGDLPDMAAHKRRVLDAAGLRGANHHVVTVNALADDGPDALAEAVRARLDPARGTAIITEGLLNYFALPDVLGMWHRFADFLRGFPAGLYLSDLNLDGDAAGMVAVRIFRRVLAAFARGRIHLHFDEAASAAAALAEAGFPGAGVHLPEVFRTEVELPDPGRGYFVRVLEARTG